jgi:hypothetical protein
MKRIAAMLLILAMTGCQQPMTWTKPGATESDFNVDRYQCMAGSQQQSSSIYIGRYSGFGSSGQTTNEPLFAACMTAKGWSLQNRSDAEKQAGPPETRAALKANIESFEQTVCTDPKFAPYYAKTACTAPRITFEQLADASKISPEVKTIFVDLRRAIEAQTEATNDILRKGSPVGAKRVDLYNAVYKPQGDRNNLDLYNGLITWGEYNKRRQDIYREYSMAAARITS